MKIADGKMLIVSFSSMALWAAVEGDGRGRRKRSVPDGAADAAEAEDDIAQQLWKN